MAVTWEVRVSFMDMATGKARITAIRTEDSVVSICDVVTIIATDQQKADALLTLWNQYEERKNNAVYIRGLEADAKAYLEGRE